MDSRLVARYRSPEGAEAYRHKYEKSLFRRLSNRRELAIVRAALARAGARGRLLDCPCGAGRLAPVLLAFGDRVSLADLSTEMLRRARESLAPATRPTDFASASISHLPFADEAFDTAVCHRLLHHLPDPADRRLLFSELRRVARRHVVLSFADATTLKAKMQRAGGRRRSRVELTPQALFAEAAACGLRPDGPVLRLNGCFSLLAVAVFKR